MLAVVGAFKQSAQLSLGGLLRTVKRFTVSLTGDAPAQAPPIRAPLVDATVAVIAFPSHYRFLAMIVARARFTPALSGVSPGSHSSAFDGATGSPFGRIFESRVSMATLKTA